MFDIAKRNEKVTLEMLNSFRSLSSATIHEAMGRKGAFSSEIKPIWPGSILCGRALTVQSEPGDNLMLHKAITLAKEGDVLVVATGGYKEAGIWGEVMTVAAIAKGIAGLVTDASVRDTVAIKKHGFPVFSMGISIKGTTKLTPGKINNPIVIGGQLVNPGDLIFGDNDGLVLVSPEDAAKALELSRQREEKEKLIMERLRNGETTMDILGLNEAFERLKLNEEV